MALFTPRRSRFDALFSKSWAAFLKAFPTERISGSGSAPGSMVRLPFLPRSVRPFTGRIFTAEMRRREHVPYHLEAYVREMDLFPPPVQRRLKRFLMKNLAIHWAAAKTEQNRWLSDKLLVYARQLNGFYGFGMRMANLLPADLFYYLARKRVSSRQKEPGT